MEHNPAHDQIKDLFTKQHASNEKLDYFMCSVAGALFAYIGQTFTPEKLPTKCCIVSILSLILLSYPFTAHIGAYKRKTRLHAVTKWKLNCAIY
jgi:hypothetical protein